MLGIYKSIHMYVRTYVSAYVRKYVRAYVRRYVRTYVSTYVSAYVRTYVRTWHFEFTATGQGKSRKSSRCFRNTTSVFKMLASLNLTNIVAIVIPGPFLAYTSASRFVSDFASTEKWCQV